MKMLETIHIFPVRAESAAPAPLRGKKLDQRAVLQVVRKVDWKKAGLIAGGVTVVCAAAGTASRYKFYQGIVARELKMVKWVKTGLFSAKSLHCYPRLRDCLLQYMAFCAQ